MAKEMVRKLSAAHLSTSALCSAVLLPCQATVFCGVKAVSSIGGIAGVSLLQNGNVNPAALVARNVRLLIFLGRFIFPSCEFWPIIHPGLTAGAARLRRPRCLRIH